MQIFGWLSSVLFMVCGIPQAWKCYKDGNANGMSLTFIVTWLLGEIFGMVYISDITPYPLPLAFNYGVSIVSTTIMLSYFLSPREKNESKEVRTIKDAKVSKKRHRRSFNKVLHKPAHKELF